MQRGSRIIVAIIALAAVAVAGASVAGDWKVVEDSDWCDNGGWGSDHDTYCEVREITIDSRDALRVDGRANGGISVEGWDRNEIRVRAKIKVWVKNGDEDDARAIADEITIDAGGREISADGPKQRRKNGWAVSYEIMVPKKTDLNLEATNGGIAVGEVEGEIHMETTNGGISIQNLSGDVRGRTTNGGIDVELSGKKWKGDGLDLRSTNGGVSLAIPSKYSAELETGTVNGGIEVDFPITVQGKIGKSLKATLGDGGPRVRVRTTNGGVHIYRS